MYTCSSDGRLPILYYVMVVWCNHRISVSAFDDADWVHQEIRSKDSIEWKGQVHGGSYVAQLFKGHD